MSAEKGLGNAAMARNDFGSAITHYTRGIEAASSATASQDDKKALAILHSNRAQAYINIKKYNEAVADCTVAIATEATFLKSHLRRATANLRRGSFDAAAADLTTLKGTPAGTLSAAGLDATMIEELLAELKRTREAQEDSMPESQRGERFLAQWLADEAHPRRFRLKSGIVCEMIKAGTGSVSPTASTACSVHYDGRLRDGTRFDSSLERGEPATFAPNQVIAGWHEVLQYMVEGDHWDIVIPYELAYGKRGSPPEIPGYSALRFEIIIVKVLDQKTAKPAAEARAALVQNIVGDRELASCLPSL